MFLNSLAVGWHLAVNFGLRNSHKDSRMRLYVLFTIVHVVWCFTINQPTTYQLGSDVYDSANATDNAIYITGTTESNLFGNAYGYLDIYLAKYDLNFNFVNSVQWGSSSDDRGLGLALHPDHNTIYLTYLLNNNAAVGAYSASDFAEIWTTTGYNGTDFNDVAYDINTNTLWIAGATLLSFPSFGQVNHGYKEAMLMQVSSEGTLLAVYLYDSGVSNVFYGMDLNADFVTTVIFCVGSVGDDNVSYQAWISAYDAATGSQENSVLYGTSGDSYDDIVDVVVYDDDSVLVFGSSRSPWSSGSISYTGSDATWVALVDSVSLNISWLHQYDTDTFNVAVKMLDDNVVVLGNIVEANSDYGLFDTWVSCLDVDSGTELSFLRTGIANSDDVSYAMFVISNHILVAGFTDGDLSGTNQGSYDLFIQKYDVELDNSSSGENGNRLGVIVGVTVGVLVAAAALVGGLLFFRHNKKKETQKRSAMPKTSSEEALPREPGKYSTRYETLGAHSSVTSQDSRTMESSSSVQSSEMQPIITRIGSNTLTNDWYIDYQEIKLDKKIGQGAFGEVYMALYRGSSVAVKQMIAVDDDVKIQDFFAEAELMKGLRPHPNITQLLGVCINPMCIVTEFVANGSLFTWLKSDKPLDDSTKFEILKGTAAGMLHLHRQGVIHRDLAARNILLDKSMTAKVSDFGLSRVTLDNVTNKTDASVGPVKWMAPEALLERVYNQKTDVWSFGVVIYEVLTRDTPYRNYNLMQIGAGVGVGKLSLVPEIEQRESEFPAVLVSVLKECLKFEAKDRPDFQQIVDCFQ